LVDINKYIEMHGQQNIKKKVINVAGSVFEVSQPPYVTDCNLRCAVTQKWLKEINRKNFFLLLFLVFLWKSKVWHVY